MKHVAAFRDGTGWEEDERGWIYRAGISNTGRGGWRSLGDVDKRVGLKSRVMVKSDGGMEWGLQAGLLGWREQYIWRCNVPAQDTAFKSSFHSQHRQIKGHSFFSIRSKAS